jgi:4-carboxymuconolactone decarboxylase
VSAVAGFTPRPGVPRVLPIEAAGRSAAQQQMLANRPDYNIFKTLAHNPQLYDRWSPLGQYLLSGSSLPARDREIVILRMGWLCQAPYEWSQHARIAKASANMSEADVHRIAQGVRADDWSEFERTLINMVDELRYDAQIADNTWAALREKYSLQQTIDAMYTAAQYQLVSMALNSLGVQLDSVLEDRIPLDAQLPALAETPGSPRLTAPRAKPLAIAEMTEEQQRLTAPQVHDGQLLNLYATLVVHTRLYAPRLRFGTYIQRESRLPPRTRELLILRTASLLKSQYEWAHHTRIARDAGFSAAQIARIAQQPQAEEWNEEERALLQAADELRREAFISAPTWQTLAKYYDTEKMLEIIFTIGGYTMTGVALNSLGIQVE